MKRSFIYLWVSVALAIANEITSGDWEVSWSDLAHTRTNERKAEHDRGFLAPMDCRLEGKSKQGGYNKEGLSYKDNKRGHYDELGSRAGRVPDGEYEAEDIEVVTPPHVVSSKKYNTRRGGSKMLVDAEFIGHDSDFQRITRRGARTRSKEHQMCHAVGTSLSATPPLPLVIISEFFSSERHVLSKSRGTPNKSEKDVEHSFLALKVRL